MCSTDLDHFQLIALALMQITCWPRKVAAKGKGSTVLFVWRKRNATEEGNILFDLCEVNCNDFGTGAKQLTHSSRSSTCPPQFLFFLELLESAIRESESQRPGSATGRESETVWPDRHSRQCAVLQRTRQIHAQRSALLPWTCSTEFTT
jgi:hypothetical protein